MTDREELDRVCDVLGLAQDWAVDEKRNIVCRLTRDFRGHRYDIEFVSPLGGWFRTDEFVCRYDPKARFRSVAETSRALVRLLGSERPVSMQRKFYDGNHWVYETIDWSLPGFSSAAELELVQATRGLR